LRSAVIDAYLGQTLITLNAGIRRNAHLVLKTSAAFRQPLASVGNGST
jgi:hypothetical protein